MDALNGKVHKGKGSHKKAKISSFSFVLKGHNVELINLEEEFSAINSQTVTYTQTKYLPPYQVEQIRDKLLALGYSPHTVTLKK